MALAGLVIFLPGCIRVVAHSRTHFHTNPCVTHIPVFAILSRAMCFHARARIVEEARLCKFVWHCVILSSTYIYTDHITRGIWPCFSHGHVGHGSASPMVAWGHATGPPPVAGIEGDVCREMPHDVPVMCCRSSHNKRESSPANPLRTTRNGVCSRTGSFHCTFGVYLRAAGVCALLGLRNHMDDCQPWECPAQRVANRCSQTAARECSAIEHSCLRHSKSLTCYRPQPVLWRGP